MLLWCQYGPATNYATVTAAASGLHVEGNQLIAANGEPVRLVGVNRAGTEYACIQGWGLFDGPADAASVAAMRAWGINTVRVPLNEHCWLGLTTVRPELGGDNYRRAIRQWVSVLREAGLYVILDLHWSAPPGVAATKLYPMPNRDYSPEFWRQVATIYRDDRAILFDLYNEPYPDYNRDTNEAWRCWRDGGTCPDTGYPVAGMQELVDAVRGTGATNVILLGGIQYANGFSQFRSYAPHDPLNNFAASWHSYNFMRYAKETSWDAQIGIPTANVPLVAGEIGQDDCQTDFLDRTLRWLDARGASYLAWTWNTWGRCNGPVLIDDFSGKPSAMGQKFYDHLAQMGPAPLAPRPGEQHSSRPDKQDPSAPVQPPNPPGALILYADVVPAPFWARPVGANGVDQCDSQVKSEGRCAFAIAFSSWGNLSIGSANGFTTAGYDHLEWAFNTHWQSLENFSLTLFDEQGQTLSTLPLDQVPVGADLGDGWVLLTLPVATLNPQNAIVRELVFRNTSGRDLSVVHLDQLRFTAANVGTALTAGAAAIGISTPNQGMHP